MRKNESEDLIMKKTILTATWLTLRCASSPVKKQIPDICLKMLSKKQLAPITKSYIIPTRKQLLDVITVALPYIGYPRTLNALAAINNIVPAK